MRFGRPYFLPGAELGSGAWTGFRRNHTGWQDTALQTQHAGGEVGDDAVHAQGDQRLDVRFTIGVYVQADELIGHAWLELNGAPLDETLSHPYTVTYAYPLQ